MKPTLVFLKISVKTQVSLLQQYIFKAGVFLNIYLTLTKYT